MQLMKLLHNTFQKSLPGIHKTRLKNLIKASITLLETSKLSLTDLGRNLSSKTQERSNIKKIDRLLGNNHLEKECVSFYQVMNEHILPKQGEVWLHVDWSCISSITNQYLLRASLSMRGRAIVIYEECHPKKHENNHAIHKIFLNRLKEVLPEEVKPIIVTDAGFRAPWFNYVRYLGWDFVGRLRNKNALLLDGDKQWQLSSEFYSLAKSIANYLGYGVLTKKGKVPAYFIAYKGKVKNRQKLNKNKTKSHCGMSQRHAKSQKEPWVLATSLESVAKAPHIAVNIYKQRMQIEENFRDTKSTRFGFGLNNSLSRSPKRLRILLLIAAIASFASWLSGIFINKKGKAHEYQAQSAKFKGSISIVFLGKQALKKGFRIGHRQYEHLLEILANMHMQAQAEAIKWP